jgi:hypothetical protein
MMMTPQHTRMSADTEEPTERNRNSRCSRRELNTELLEHETGSLSLHIGLDKVVNGSGMMFIPELIKIRQLIQRFLE